MGRCVHHEVIHWIQYRVNQNDIQARLRKGRLLHPPVIVYVMVYVSVPTPSLTLAEAPRWTLHLTKLV